VLECVINVSEGHDTPALAAIIATAQGTLLDAHRDEHHNRAVLTLAGDEVEDAARRVAVETVERLDIGTHRGVHPRIGVLDVVPFVPLEGSRMEDAVRARDAFAAWATNELGLTCFLYGPERSLPEVRREATRTAGGHPTAGHCAVGARPVLVAYNLWLVANDVGTAKAIAAGVRSPAVRALGLQVGDHVQVSCNLVAPDEVGPAEIYDAVAAEAPVARAELVGLAPAAVVRAVHRDRWAELGLSEDQTIEVRLRRSR
jgi:glutamate formiminotransferase